MSVRLVAGRGRGHLYGWPLILINDLKGVNIS
jgi:hypothetical protein